MKQRKVGMQKVVSVLLLVALLLTFATPAFADGGPMPEKADPFPTLPSLISHPLVKKTITDYPSFDDASWPITKVERRTFMDDNGNIHTHVIIIRELHVDSPMTAPCESSATAVSGTCQYVGMLSQNDIDSRDGVTAHQVHYADKYCKDGNCSPMNTYFKMTKVENWWTRQNSSQTTSNAVFRWGCTGNCYICSGGTTGFGYFYEDTDVDKDITWYGNRTSTIVYQSDGWAIMVGSNDVTDSPGAIMSSEVGSGLLEVRTWWMTQ